jgi:integrase
MGCTYRRGKTYWIKYYKNGKSYAESTHSDKMEVAKRILKMREGEIAQGKTPGICFEKVKFDEIMDDYVTDYRINGRRTVAKAERCAGYLKEEFKGMKALEVNTPLIKKYIEKRMSEGKANATINRELAALKKAFNLAVRCTPPKVPQVPYVPMMKENNVRKGFIEYEEFMAFQDALPVYLKPVLIFAYLTGWRRSEILNMQWNQVNLKEGSVRLEPGETKNKEGRTIYMEPELWAVMQKLYKSRVMSCLHVFHSQGKKISDFRGAWSTACKAIGKPGMLFHDLRRSGVRNMVRAGISERVAMTISGHKTRSVFDRYNIVSQEDLKDAALKRQEFSTEQAEQLQNGYNRPSPTKKVTKLRVVTS